MLDEINGVGRGCGGGGGGGGGGTRAGGWGGGGMGGGGAVVEISGRHTYTRNVDLLVSLNFTVIFFLVL